MTSLKYEQVLSSRFVSGNQRVTIQDIQEKTARLEELRTKTQLFVDGCGDLRSRACSLGVEFVAAYADLAKEFAYKL